MVNPFKPYFVLRPKWLVRRAVRQLMRSEASGPVPLDWGVSLTVGSDEIGRTLWWSGVYEVAVSEAIWRLLDPGDLAIDAGANFGYMTSIMARRTGSRGRVIAFEPHPELFAQLTANVSLMAQAAGTAPVEAHELALSDRAGVSRLSSGPIFASNRGTARIGDSEEYGAVYEVRTGRLDEIVGEGAPALLKLDVEGHELHVLQGATSLLTRKAIRSIVYEAHGHKAAEVREYLLGFGYRSFALGWRWNGPLIGDPGRPLSRGYEPPNYIATAEDSFVEGRLKPRGWTFWQGGR